MLWFHVYKMILIYLLVKTQKQTTDSQKSPDHHRKIKGDTW